MMKKNTSGASGYISPRIALEERCAEQNRQIIQLTADISKLRSEIEDQKIAGHYQERKILLNFIEVADAMERLISHVEERSAENEDAQVAWSGNLRTIYKLLQRSLLRGGVEQIAVEPGEKADPQLHVVAEVATAPERENEEILRVLKNGYRWRGTVLRPAEVRTVFNGNQDRKE